MCIRDRLACSTIENQKSVVHITTIKNNVIGELVVIKKVFVLIRVQINVGQQAGQW